MHTTYDSVRDGRRVDIEVQLLAKQTKSVGGDEVQRLLVADSKGTKFFLVRTLAREVAKDLNPGSTLRVSGVLGLNPVSQGQTIDENCPQCDGTLRSGQAIDTVNPLFQQVTTDFDFKQTFGMVDETASIYSLLKEEGRVDDWNPMNQDRSISVPDYVCVDCGETKAVDLDGDAA